MKVAGLVSVSTVRCLGLTGNTLNIPTQALLYNAVYLLCMCAFIYFQVYLYNSLTVHTNPTNSDVGSPVGSRWSWTQLSEPHEQNQQSHWS